MPKIGDKIIILGNTGGHNYTIGRKYIICSMNNGYYGARDPESGWMGNSLQISEFEIVKDKIDLKSLENIE